MGRNLDIHVHHLTRVEGHGNIVVSIRDGEVVKAQFEVVEAPRYFEAFLRGRSFHEAAIVTSRICGICSLGHQMTSLKATEAALGLAISEQTRLLRELLVHAATFQSHVLHSLFLVAPDLLGVGSVFPLVATHPEVVKAALRLKALANDVGTLVSGRAVHPVSCVPGGFTSFPGASALRAVKAQIEGEGMRDLALAVEVVASLAGRVPAFARENEYISLKSGAEYAFYDGDICSSDAGTVPVAQYREVTNEHIVPHSTAKHCRFHRSSYMVGALARWNNNYRQINGSGRAVAEKLGFSGPSNNPFANTVAQVVETAHCVEEALRILDLLLTRGLEEEKPNQSPTRYGQGVGATEVPRGVLFHDYTYDRRGLIEKANCIIPTNQNFASMDDDLKKLVPELVELPEKELTHRLEMLIRAYDPCISCAVHVVRV